MSSVDVAVIGRGLIGSAAARHLAEGGLSTALIGPSEPQDREASAGPFSSHGDEGRITRIAGRAAVWSGLAARSIRRYGDLERRSDLPFHTRRGLVVSMAEIDDWIDAGLIYGSNIHKISAAEVKTATGLTITGPHPVAYEGPPAGYINPRRLVMAQTKLTELAGGIVVDASVSAINRVDGAFELQGGFGTTKACRLLLATGAFGRGLLDVQLDVQRQPRTILLAEMGERSTLPSLIMADPPDQRLAEIYWVPPIRYPDGRTYLKIGGSLRSDPRLPGETDLVEWFHSAGDQVEAKALEVSLRALLPEAEFTSFVTEPCVITSTSSGYPYLGWVDEGIAVAIGGNGSAAKSSDELGRLAASLFSPDGWTDSLDASVFEPQFVS
ncbi:MAG: FAD-binding oxidoreductase [Actinomycetia bacterium]|nr:FAD-binding oxidoreductase [Actinomycetes bacterium]